MHPTRDEHEILYSGSSLLLGDVHWYFLRATSLIEKESTKPVVEGEEKKFRTLSEIQTPFGMEVQGNEIHWWVYQKENDHDLLLSKSEETLEALQILKEDSDDLKTTFITNSYPEIIKKIKEFSDNHLQELQMLHNYVQWLSEKDPRSPSILFSFLGWGSASGLADRRLPIYGESIESDDQILQSCTLVSWGLSSRICLTKGFVERELECERIERYGLDYDRFPLDQKIVMTKTSQCVLDEMETYFEKLRNSLNHIIAEITKFKKEPLPVVRTLNLGNREKEVIRFCIVQIDFSLISTLEPFGFKPDEESCLKEKIFSAIKVAQENNVDLICFPELSFKKDWVVELLQLSTNLTIICGSYYENSYNVCPVIIRGRLVEQPYQKFSPSPDERGIVHGEEMKSGKVVYVYKTDIGTFSTLTCVDYAELSRHILAQTKSKLDFIVNPSYDDNITRFQAQCNTDTENQDLTIIQVNRAEDQNGKYGKSSIFCKEHRKFIDLFTSKCFRDPCDDKYLLIKLRNEAMVIADINLSIPPPPVDLSLPYPGRLKILKFYELTNLNWKPTPISCGEIPRQITGILPRCDEIIAATRANVTVAKALKIINKMLGH